MKKPEGREIATIRHGRDITRGDIDQLVYLPPLDSVLNARGGGDWLVYENTLRDGRVRSALEQRRVAVSGRPVRVIPGGGRRRDRLAAEEIGRTIDRIRWRTVCERMLFGVYYGFSVGECLWRRSGDTVELAGIRVRNRRRFRFDAEFRLRLLTHARPDGELLPPGKFWSFATGADHDDEPYGLGLAHWLYWPVFFRRQQMPMWLNAQEKFGAPTLLGKYRPGASEKERSELLAALGEIRSRAGVIAPSDAQIDLLEAARSGNMDFQAFQAAMGSEITQIILGQTMTSEDGSSLSQAQVHMAVRREIVEADAALIADSANRSWVTWLTAWNFPGAAVPKIEILMDESGRQAAQSSRDEAITRMGYRLDPSYIEETYGVRVAGERRPAPSDTELAEGDPDPLLAALDAIDNKDWEALASPLIQPILDRARADPEDLMSDVASLYPELDATAVEEMLARILFVADTWERLQRGASGDA